MNARKLLGGYGFTRRRRSLVRHATARLTFWAGAVGVGLVAVVFGHLIDWAERQLYRGTFNNPWLTFVLMPAIGIVGLWVVRRWYPGIAGSGIPQVMAEMQRRPDEKWTPLVAGRLAVAKIVVGVSAIGAGFSFGREGPMVQIGASVMSMLRDRLPRAANIEYKHLLVVGGAAGIAAAVNAPRAGILFAIEELNRGIESRMSGLIITAIVFAGVTARALMGNQSYFGHILITGSNRTIIEMVLASAVFTGVLGGLFARMLTRSSAQWHTPLGRLRERRPYLFVALCGVLVAAIGWITDGHTHGTGYAPTVLLLEGEKDLPWYFGPAKYIATIVSYLTGLPGGIFAPSLAIGAGLGQDLHLLMGGNAPPGMLVAFCMTGFLAAVTQAPITSFVIVMEMVEGYPLVIGLMFVALIASGISRSLSPSLYTFLAERMVARERARAVPAVPPTTPPASG